MQSVTETTEVVREVSIAARPETVWPFLVDPELAKRWMGVEATLEPVPGGTYRVEVLSGRVAHGAFVEIDEPRRVVFTWGWDPDPDGTANAVPPGSSTVEIVLEEEGDGTLLRLTHRGLPTEEAAGMHAHGWEHYLARLATAGAGGDAGRDTWLDGGMS